jgi:26S proteasome regulatory subunit N3
VDAVLDHEGRCLASREVTDVYATREPQAAFHRRIGFCLDVHNEAVRGLRYPPGAHRGDLESAEARREREREEEELAKEIEEGHLDDEDDDGME